MASMSRCMLKDCKFQLNDAVFTRPTSCYPYRSVQSHLDLRHGLSSLQTRCLSTAQNKEKPLSPVVTSFSPLSQPSRSPLLLCKAATDYSGDVPSSSPKELSQYEKIIETLTTLFPVWVIVGTLIGIYKPAAVTWLQTDLFTVGLGFLMLSMGLTLTFEDFRRCLRNPWTVGVGFLAQYIIKPMLGFVIALTLKLSAPLATGLILVSCCPGGQASNVATYISKGNVALSVLMTTCSTIGAIIMTPLLTKLLAGQLVPVDAAGLALSTFQVVLVPTIIGGNLKMFGIQNFIITNSHMRSTGEESLSRWVAGGWLRKEIGMHNEVGKVVVTGRRQARQRGWRAGREMRARTAEPDQAMGRLYLSYFRSISYFTVMILANEFFPKFTAKIITVTPLIGVILTTLLCASPIGQVADVLKTQGAQLILPVAILHAAAFAIGYWISKLSFGESTSPLGFLLAQKHFTNPLVAVPSAVSVVFMALGGSALAVYWRNQPIPADDKDDFKE
ncbi:hypothetical protein KSS87_015481 [Heliosperma pusillum]|nr:hypothetical protein KSS87_015481 [Heliosperma pusillum]